MAITLVITTFILGYIAIAFEHPLKLNKAASALITGVLCWTIYVLQLNDSHLASEQLLHHLGEISSILFFLLGAMTIVELIDSHNGFDIITEKIRTTSKPKLLFIITTLTFFLSALLDNLTTAILMTSLCAKLLQEKEDKLWFCGMIVIAANSGGAWSPLGDVTTNGRVLIRLAAGIEERHDRRVDPVVVAVLGAVAQFAVPDATVGDRVPQLANHRF